MSVLPLRRLALATLLVLSLVPATTIAQTATGPQITGIRTLDLWHDELPLADGRIDTIEVTFDADLDPATLHISDFHIEGRIIIDHAMASGSVLQLRIKEQGFDTDAKPSLTFTEGRLTGTTGEPAEDPGVATVDGAAPIAVSATVPVGSTDGVLRFSEPVTTGAGPVTLGDLSYQDRSGSGAAGITAVTHTDQDPDVAFTLDTAAITADLDMDQVTPSTSIVDLAGNNADSSSTPLRGPVALEARADVGSERVTVRFSVPVQAKNGGPLKSTAAFDVVYDAPPDDPIRGIEAVEHTAGSHEVVVVLTDPVQQRDVRSLEPAILRVIQESVYDADTGAALPDMDLPLSDKTIPRLLGAATEDRDRNGYLDAMVLFWSEPVDPVCVDGLHVDGFELDLGTGELPFVDPSGKQVTIKIKEHSTQAPDTGLVPDFTYNACANGAMAFQDQADPPNPARALASPQIEEVDGAAPAIIHAETEDDSLNGHIDRYVLVFSEPMARTFNVKSWQVVGYEMESLSWDPDETRSDTWLSLNFKEGPDGDTGEVPLINYKGSEMEDLAGNKLAVFEGGGFERVDRAPPRIVDAFGDEGSRVIYVVFSEPVEAVTDPADPSGPGRGIQEKDFGYQNSGGGNAGIANVRHIKGEAIAKLDLSGPLEAIDFGSNGDRILPLAGHIRESNAEAAADRDTVASAFVSFVERDITPPGAGTDPTWDAEFGNATLTFTAGADDAGDADSGPMTSYLVHVNRTELPEDLDTDAFLELDAWDEVYLEPAAPVAPGAQQKILVEGLCPAGLQPSVYHVAIVGLDEDGNPSPVLLAPELSLAKDPTPPTGTLTFTSAEYLVEDGVPVGSHDPSGAIAWSGVADPDTGTACPLEYRWRIDSDPEGEATLADNATTQAGIDMVLPADTPLPAERYLHVMAVSGGGTTESFTHPLLILVPTECEADMVTDLEAVNENGFTTLTWDPVGVTPREDLELLGYQVWMREDQDAPWVLRETLERNTTAFEEHRFIDDGKVSVQADYLITGYFTGDFCRVVIDADGVSQRPFTEFEEADVLVIEPPATVPTWAWVTLTALAILAIAGVVLFYGLRRTKLDESWLEDEEDEDDHGNPFGSDPITDLGGDAPPPRPAGGPTLDIACPACNHEFQTTGTRPLQITCPSCNASGVLE